jgi:DNA gyrase subunit A
MDRPDLSSATPEILAYIESLETQLKIKSIKNNHSNIFSAHEPAEYSNEFLPSEPPTTINIVTISKTGFAKRTLRHLYARQHRGGMGVFDLDVDLPDYTATLTTIDEGQHLLLFTNFARVFRQNIIKFQPAPIRSKGEYLLDRLPLDQNEYVVAALPELAVGYVCVASAGGKIRCLRHHLFGEHMKPGMMMFQYKEFGPLAAVCWTSGESDLFLATQNGLAIRFNEKLVTPQGDIGIKIAPGDQVVSITGVYANAGVFLLGSDGKGTVRMMSGFAANKSMGGSGKLAMRCQKLIGAVALEDNDDLFIITRLGKIIRFRADEVPPTEGVIQGVNCISMRNDEVTSLLKTGL